MEDYRFTLTPDKITRSNVDLGSLGGPRLAGDERKNITYLMINSVKTKLFKMNFFCLYCNAVAEFIEDGNTLMTRLHKPDTDEVDVLAIRTIDPNFPNVMIYKLKDVETGHELIQHMDRQI